VKYDGINCDISTFVTGILGFVIAMYKGTKNEQAAKY